ncbi:MAG: glycoside hydrolase family 3 N-terminal domain-containing protein [Acidimicrobiales bacterium]
MAPPSEWSSAALAEQLLLVSAQFSDLSASATQAGAGVGGFVLFGEPPAGTSAAITTGITSLDETSAAHEQVTPWMSTDEEGGYVARLADVLGALPSPRVMAANWSPAQITAVMTAHARAMRALGVTVDLAPVVDTAPSNDTVADEQDRSFSDDPSVAATDGVAYLQGLRAGGVVAVVKHFPGLGHAGADTDLSASTDPSLAQLDQVDLIPFEQAIGAGVPVVMVGHPMVPGLTDGMPASLSPATYRLLRQTLHFGGVAITDSLAAGAISAAGYSEAAAAVTAVEAGADMAMIDSSSWSAAQAALVDALGTGALTLRQAHASVARILSAKGVMLCRT